MVLVQKIIIHQFLWEISTESKDFCLKVYQSL